MSANENTHSHMHVHLAHAHNACYLVPLPFHTAATCFVQLHCLVTSSASLNSVLAYIFSHCMIFPPLSLSLQRSKVGRRCKEASSHSVTKAVRPVDLVDAEGKPNALV